MSRHPTDPGPPRYRREPTWTEVAIGYVLIALVPVVLWVLQNPLTGVVVLASLAGLVVGVRRAVRLARCLQTCGGFAVELPGQIQVCITRQETVCSTA